MCEDFNRDIALIGHYANDQYYPPSEPDHLWHSYITNNQLTYIPTDTTYSRQGGSNYINTSLLDEFYYKGLLTNITSYTLLNLQQNSDHFLLKLILPSNILLSEPPCQICNNPSRLLNPIPQDKLDSFNHKFFTQHLLLIDKLTILLQPPNLSIAQWHNAFP